MILAQLLLLVAMTVTSWLSGGIGGGEITECEGPDCVVADADAPEAVHLHPRICTDGSLNCSYDFTEATEPEAEVADQEGSAGETALGLDEQLQNAPAVEHEGFVAAEIGDESEECLDEASEANEEEEEENVESSLLLRAVLVIGLGKRFFHWDIQPAAASRAPPCRSILTFASPLPPQQAASTRWWRGPIASRLASRCAVVYGRR